MARTYTLKKRAEQQAETRQRIVEAAVDLHGSVGPAATTFSMVAERAGVQRHTLYAHFPDERSLLTACSGLVQDRDPPPDGLVWRDIADDRQRLSTGLRTVYDWYAGNAALLSCVLRDAEHHALTRRGQRAAVRSFPESLARGARRRTFRRTAPSPRPGAELLHLAHALPGGRPHAARRRQGHGARHRMRGETSRDAAVYLGQCRPAPVSRRYPGRLPWRRGSRRRRSRSDPSPSACRSSPKPAATRRSRCGSD